jgi:hypothetical protein
MAGKALLLGSNPRWGEMVIIEKTTGRTGEQVLMTAMVPKTTVVLDDPEKTATLLIHV